MRKLLNTLFVTSEDAYLTIDGENVVVNREKQEIGRFPLHTLEQILCFSYAGASPALMGGCAQRGVGLTFCTPRGRFLARSQGEWNGNVLLRRTQYRLADDPAEFHHVAGSRQAQGRRKHPQAPDREQVPTAFPEALLMGPLVKQHSFRGPQVLRPLLFQVDKRPLPWAEAIVLEAGNLQIILLRDGLHVDSSSFCVDSGMVIPSGCNATS